MKNTTTQTETETKAGNETLYGFNLGTHLTTAHEYLANPNCFEETMKALETPTCEYVEIEACTDTI